VFDGLNTCKEEGETIKAKEKAEKARTEAVSQKSSNQTLLAKFTGITILENFARANNEFIRIVTFYSGILFH